MVTVKGASIPGARLISQPGASHGAADSDGTVMVRVSGVCNVNSNARVLGWIMAGSRCSLLRRWVSKVITK